MESLGLSADSLLLHSTVLEIRETYAGVIPGDTVSLSVPTEILLTLPEGASFSSKEGRTRVSLKRQGENVVAEAETDSVGQSVSRYERRARDSLMSRCDTATYRTETKAAPKSNTWAFWIVVGIVGTILSIIVIRMLLSR